MIRSPLNWALSLLAAVTACVAAAEDQPFWQLDLSGATMAKLAGVAGDVDSPIRNLASEFVRDDPGSGRCRIAAIPTANGPRTVSVIDFRRPETDLHAFLAKSWSRRTIDNHERYYNSDLGAFAEVQDSRLIAAETPELLRRPILAAPLPAMESALSGVVWLTRIPRELRPRSAALHNVNKITVEATETTVDRWRVVFKFESVSADDAAQTAAIIEGLIAFAKMRSDQPRPLANLAQRATTSVSDATVTVVAEIDRAAIRTILNPPPIAARE